MSFVPSKILLALVLATTAAVLPACSTYSPAPKAFHQATIQPYTLDSGDRMRVSVFEQPGLNIFLTVITCGIFGIYLATWYRPGGETR